MKKVKTPECDKINKFSENSQQIGGFLSWLAGQEISLAEWTGSDCEECGTEHLIPIIQTREKLLARYFCIDLDKAEKERQALLDALRAEDD